MWHLKKRQTLPLAKLCDGIKSAQDYERLGRIRDTYATEIQQRMLADMGRVGQPANPPATFPMSISLYANSADATARQVLVNGVETAVCFVGRDKDGHRVDHLVLSETACDLLKAAVQEYPLSDVNPAAKPSLAAMKRDIEFFDRFERGRINVPHKNGKWQEEKGADQDVYLHIVRNEGVDEGNEIKGNCRKAPFVMKVSDIRTSDAD